jgi:hypothetical protein
MKTPNMKKLFLLLTSVSLFFAGTAQKPTRVSESDKLPDLSIVSVTLTYPTPATVPTRTTSTGTAQGKAVNPITQCTVNLTVTGNDDGNVVLTVTLPSGVKVQQMPAGATTSVGPDYNPSFDGSIKIPVGTMRMGQTVSLQFTYLTPTSTSIFNSVTATVKGDKAESNTSNNTRSASLR